MKQELSTYEYLDKMEMDVEVLEDMEIRLQQKSSSKSKLHQIIIELREVEYDLANIPDVVSAEEELNQLLSLQKDLESKQSQIVELEYITLQLKDIDNKKKYYTPICTDADKELEKLLRRAKKVEALSTKVDDLFPITRDLRKVIGDRILADKLLQTKKKLFHENFPDVCPLCGQTIKKK